MNDPPALRSGADLFYILTQGFVADYALAR